MTAVERPVGRRVAVTAPVLLLAAFAAAVGLRVAVGGVGVSQSPRAGLVFAAALLVVVAATGLRVPLDPSIALRGMAGAALLCVPAALAQVVAGRALHAQPGFAGWAVVVTVVAVAEELFLRGVLYDAVLARAGAGAAVGVGAVAFALLHVPLYGWGAVPLDLVVGIVLGLLRRRTGSPAAPAIAHAGADLAAWFLR